MNKKFFNNVTVIISFVLYLFLTLFIFVSSLTNGEESGEQSAFVWSIISSILKIDGNYEFLIRKGLGHFSLFLILAIFASVVYYRLVEISFTSKKTARFVVLTLLVGFFTAVVSEILQLPIFVNGRSASVIDVVIDFSGYCLGFIIFIGIKVFFFKTK